MVSNFILYMSHFSFIFFFIKQYKTIVLSSEQWTYQNQHIAQRDQYLEEINAILNPEKKFF